jgi:hypothetical protein
VAKLKFPFPVEGEVPQFQDGEMAVEYEVEWLSGYTDAVEYEVEWLSGHTDRVLVMLKKVR